MQLQFTESAAASTPSPARPLSAGSREQPRPSRIVSSPTSGCLGIWAGTGQRAAIGGSLEVLGQSPGWAGGGLSLSRKEEAFRAWVRLTLSLHSLWRGACSEAQLLRTPGLQRGELCKVFQPTEKLPTSGAPRGPTTSTQRPLLIPTDYSGREELGLGGGRVALSEEGAS